MKSEKGQTHDDNWEGRGSYDNTVTCYAVRKKHYDGTMMVIRPAGIDTFVHLIIL